MKQIQGAFFTGYVTILVEGSRPELFLQYCAEQEIQVWNIKKESRAVCKANVRRSDLSKVDEFQQNEAYTITVVHDFGLPYLVKKLIGRKELLISIGVCFLLILYLSNIVWDIKINGVPKEIEKKITKQLNNYGVHRGALRFSIESPSVIQQKLLHDIPELLWVGVEKKGTTFQLEVVEKTIVEKKEVNGPSNLVATKEGVISYIYISKGKPKVEVNDYVKPGKILVSGNLREGEKDAEPELVEAEGQVVAKTWYEATVTVPLEVEYQELTGENDKKLYLSLGNVQVPFWGFGSSDFEHTQTDINRTPIHFLKWELPIKIIESIQHEKTYIKEKRTKEEAIAIGKEQAKNELLLRLDEDAKVISQKVLHESTGNGKVKLILYMTVEENIAKSVPINQGD